MDLLPSVPREVLRLAAHRVAKLAERDAGKTIFFSTHILADVEAICDRVAIMDKGNMVAMDTPAGLKKLVPQQNGDEPTLEDVFLALTGKQLNSDEVEK